MAGDPTPMTDLIYKTSDTEQHVYYHYANDEPKIAVKVEHNSRGNNWEVSVSNAKTVHEAMLLLIQAESELNTAFGPQVEAIQAKADA